MKSMLHEAITVEKAISEAWNMAGKPQEFTVKILDSGKKGLLWFNAQPAIVSIVYKPTTQTKQSVRSPSQSSTRKNPSTISSTRAKKGVSSTKQQTSSKPQKNQAIPIAPYWSKENVVFVEDTLKEILTIINVSTPFTSKVNKKILYITFTKNSFSSRDEERSFYISVASLLMQFLKKKCMNKLRGFQINISSGQGKEQQHDKKKSSSS